MANHTVSRLNVILNKLYAAIGVEQAPVSHAEKIVSAIGGFAAIASIFVLSRWSVDPVAAALLVTSMGASAVLLFAVPHGPLSQPWPVAGGHVISALIGVACAQMVSNEVIAASLAVGLAIGAMYYLKCVHPPGGATALSAVVGGEATHALGYQFIITPVLVNVAIILLVGFLYNYMFARRRYPVSLHRLKKKRESGVHTDLPAQISHADFVYALSQIDSFVDVSEYELLRIYELAINKSQESAFAADELVLGHYYSNGKYGNDWSVRQIVDQSPHTDPHKDMLIYKIVAGKGRRASGYATRTEFLHWAKHQVIRDEDNWKRAE
jgi:CBS-domain-containing membrane protein